MATIEALKNLKTPGNVQAEYIWIDGFGGTRSKGRTLVRNDVPTDPADLPDWNYDGSSTGQAPGDDSEVVLKPRAIFKDPFRGEAAILVMCDTYDPAGNALPTNKRLACDGVMTKAKDLKPWFGIEQEYFLEKDGRPLGFPERGYPEPQGPYYCGAGGDKAYGRDIADAHWKACLYAGIQISGINGEVAPGQWEFQVGPCEGIKSGDQLWVARYILCRVAEMAGLGVNFEVKPVLGDWNGSGCHTNYSTEPMRQDGGYEKAIIPALELLSKKQKEHMAVYGKGNEARCTGAHETASYDKFSWGVANRGASCRVGHDTAKEGKGYFEDRRPGSNMDPYEVTGLLVSTTCEIPM